MVLKGLSRRKALVLVAAYLLALVALSCLLLLYAFLALARPWRRSVPEACALSGVAHEALFKAVRALGPREDAPRREKLPATLHLLDDPPQPLSEKLSAHDRVRHYASQFLMFFNTCQSAIVEVSGDNSPSEVQGRTRTAGFLRGLSPVERSALEFRHMSRYPVDGVLQYIFGILGVRNKIAVELDSGRGNAVFFGAASFAVYDGWDVVALYRLWSGYNRAQQFYESSGARGAFVWRKNHFDESSVVVSEEPIDSIGIDGALQRLGVGGSVDVAFLMLDGAEWSVWNTLSAIRPRVVVCFYQDYWGADAMLVREWNSSDPTASSPGESDGVDVGRKRLFAGASLAALVARGRSLGFRLVWCLSSSPIAVFLRDTEDSNGFLLPALLPEACLASRQSRTWRKDMEAQWHRAQLFEWTAV